SRSPQTNSHRRHQLPKSKVTSFARLHLARRHVLPPMNPVRLVFAALAVGATLLPSTHEANCVLDWNQEVLNATRLARNPPPLAAEFFATFHLAIFDAVNGITRTHNGWLVNEPAP